MLFQKEHSVLYGAWEEPNVIGTRVEIGKKHIQILWQGGIVLDTAYAVRETESRIELHLKHCGLRYQGAASDYAEVISLYYTDNALHLQEHFPVTGESETILQKTDKSRYGNYDLADDEILPKLQGIWQDADGYETLCFRADVLTIGTFGTHIHVLKSRSDGRYKIADIDPARHGLYHFCEVFFTEEEITAVLPVCDAPSCIYRFRKT